MNDLYQGKEVADGAMFCTSCGTKLAQEPAVQPAAEQPAPAPSQGTPQAASDTAPVSAPATTAKKLNPGIIIAVAAVLVIALILLLSGGGGGYKEYKDLAKAYYEAINKEDVNAMIKLFDKETQKDLKEDKKYVKEALEEMRDDLIDDFGRSWFKDLEIGRKEKKGTGRDTYKIRVEIDGKLHEYLGIKRDDKDRYYIDEDYFHY